MRATIKPRRRVNLKATRRRHSQAVMNKGASGVFKPKSLYGTRRKKKR